MSFIVWHSLALVGAMAVAFAMGYMTAKARKNKNA